MQLGGGPGDEHHRLVLRVDLEGHRPDVAPRVAERERVEALAAVDVDDLELLLVGALDVEPGAIGREAHDERRPGDAAGPWSNCAGRFVHDGEVAGIRSDERSCRRRRRALRRRLAVASHSVATSERPAVAHAAHSDMEPARSIRVGRPIADRFRQSIVPKGHHGGQARSVDWTRCCWRAALAALATLDADQAAPDRTRFAPCSDRAAGRGGAHARAAGRAGARPRWRRWRPRPRWPSAACGVAGLAALRDRRIVPPVTVGAEESAFRDEAPIASHGGRPTWRAGLTAISARPSRRWSSLLADAALWTAAGDDADPAAGRDRPACGRADRLAAELERPQKETTLERRRRCRWRREGRAAAPGPGGRARGKRRSAPGRGNLYLRTGAARIGAVAFDLVGPRRRLARRGPGAAAGRRPATLRPTRAHGPAQTWCERAGGAVLPSATPPNGRVALVAELDGDERLAATVAVVPPRRGDSAGGRLAQVPAPAGASHLHQDAGQEGAGP